MANFLFENYTETPLSVYIIKSPELGGPGTAINDGRFDMLVIPPDSSQLVETDSFEIMWSKGGGDYRRTKEWFIVLDDETDLCLAA